MYKRSALHVASKNSTRRLNETPPHVQRAQLHLRMMRVFMIDGDLFQSTMSPYCTASPLKTFTKRKQIAVWPKAGVYSVVADESMARPRLTKDALTTFGANLT